MLQTDIDYYTKKCAPHNRTRHIIEVRATYIISNGTPSAAAVSPEVSRACYLVSIGFRYLFSWLISHNNPSLACALPFDISTSQSSTQQPSHTHHGCTHLAGYCCCASLIIITIYMIHNIHVYRRQKTPLVRYREHDRQFHIPCIASNTPHCAYFVYK